MRNSAFGICENKDADQMRSYYTAYKRLCFGLIPLPVSPQIQVYNHLSSLCRTFSVTLETGSLDAAHFVVIWVRLPKKKIRISMTL